MRIVIDTNVMIAGIFFGGFPRRVVEAVLDRRVTACASEEIVEEYREIIREMIVRKQGRFRESVFHPLLQSLKMVAGETRVEICRDPDDDKFISCAMDGQCVYIVSGDKDLLDLKKIKSIQIVTARSFCEEYLDEEQS